MDDLLGDDRFRDDRLREDRHIQPYSNRSKAWETLS